MSEAILIRTVTPEDAAPAAALCASLGYPVSECEMRSRIETRLRLPDRTILVACEGPFVAGWIDIGMVHHLQTGSYAEIGGLVVAESMRGRGIGKQLVRQAEAWADGRGVSKILVRSNVVRERAHQFYLQQDYARVKTSAVFEKLLKRKDSPLAE